MYAFVFIDDGKFKLRIFGKERKEQQEFLDEEFDINKALDINDYTMPIQGFPDPYINCAFVTNDLVYVALFYNFDMTHYNFMYDHRTRSIVEGSVKTLKMECTPKNFPYKSFYNDEDGVCYTFYRQGEAITVNPDKPDELKMEKMTDMDLG